MTETQPTLFDLAEGRRLRDAGIARVRDHSPEWILEARRVAVIIARRQGTVNANEVRAVLEPLGIVPKHHNSWGSLFSGRLWERTGERVQSQVVASHAREISVWRLRRITE